MDIFNKRGERGERPWQRSQFSFLYIKAAARAEKRKPSIEQSSPLLLRRSLYVYVEALMEEGQRTRREHTRRDLSGV
jgi:hypothetical protein